MSVIEAFILGIVQGLTEFLPISSSGHLVIGQKILGISVVGNVFEIIVHLGTLGSILLIFWNDIWQLLKSLKNVQTQRYILAIIIGTLPAVIIGFIFKDTISAAFENIRVVAITLMITGLVLLSTKYLKSKPDEVRIGSAILIGLAQALAIIPGISRSGMTISMGMYLGIDPAKSARFSFLLAVPAIIGAGILMGWDMTSSAEPSLPWTVLSVGFFSSLLVGWLSLKWLIGLIKTGKFHWFGVYCLAVGLLSWIL